MFRVPHSLHFTEADFIKMSSSFIQAKSRVRNWLGCVPVLPLLRAEKVRKRGEAAGGRGGGERVRAVGKNVPRSPGPRGVWEGLCGHTLALQC